MRQIAEERAREIENAILEYGKNNTDGFFSKNTVDEIFNDLSKSIPTLSKTTVYNTLKIFAEKGAILSLTIDEKMVRFDGYNQRHAHFRCLNCNKVFDIPLNHDVEFPKEEATKDFQNIETHVYHRGYCSECAKEKKKIKKLLNT